MTHEPWKNEAAELDFNHAGLPCVMRRGPSGGWCGYVGIDENHPWHGKDYSDQVQVPQSIAEREIDIDKIGVINLLCASGKADAIAEGFLDIVLALDVHGGLTYARDHEPMGEADGRWWFGFDCAHAGDLSPKYSLGLDDVYRDQAYVEQECRNLADQLVTIKSARGQQ